MSAPADDQWEALNDASLKLCLAQSVLRTCIDAMDESDADKEHVNALYGVLDFIERAKDLVDGPCRPKRVPEPQTAADVVVRLDS